MKKIHIAIAVADLDASVSDYTNRLGEKPVAVVHGAYALWRTETVNLSIRCTKETPGTLRHLGWEDSSAEAFSEDKDVNGIVWERFTAFHQAQEIVAAWPDSTYVPSKADPV